MIYEDFIIYGFAGSTSEVCAEENSLKFAVLKTPVDPGIETTAPESTQTTTTTTVTTSQSTTAANGTQTQTTSPDTGDGSTAALLAGAAALFGAVLCARNRKQR